MDSKFRAGNADRKASFRAGEPVRVVLSFTAFFLILCSYYILRPVRDEMAVQYGADKLHWLFTGTFLLTLLVVPLFGWVVKRIPRSYVLPAAYGFLIANLLAFCIAFSTGVASVAVAAAFFMWLSVFNLFVVSLFWSNVSDSFSTEESHRLYGYIATGGTAGALAGPAITALLAKHVSTAYLVALSSLLLAGAAICIVALRGSRPADAQDHSRPIGGSIMAGIPLTFKLSSLRGVALLVICYTAVSTALYVEMVDLVGKTYSGSGERKAFFATVDLAVNGVSLMLQLLGTRHIVQRYGLRLALSAVPLIVLTGLGALAAWGTITNFAIVQILHRAGEYAIGRPGREMIYTTVDAESRYKAKNFIDTAVYRANDAASAWLIAAIRGIGLNAIVFVGMPAAIAWLITGLKVGRQHDQFDRSRSNGST
ncbi:MAG: Major Facilitator Superfamily protein [Herminiimonas sp.]|nr:Major Facilitator Superfamily protein [Herminiimonas sp.]